VTLMQPDVPVILWLCLFMVLANLAVFRGLKPSTPLSPPPLVSILVPARNEARNIAGCLSSLLAQDYPNFEVIVLDDNSEDDTKTIASQLIEREGKQKKAAVVGGSPLPEDWSGKNWACHQLAQHAKGEFLLFTDADTTHAPGTVTAAIRFAQSRNAGLLTAWPRFVTKTLGEKVIIPIIVLIGLVFCAHWLIALLQRFPVVARKLGSRFTRAIGAANGQFMFFTRDCYNKIGGHAALRDNIVEDVALGREVTARMGDGMRLCICDAFRFSQVRMYRSFQETWAGFSKNLRAMFGQQRFVFWLFLLGLWACFLVPTIKWIWVPDHARNIVLLHAAIVIGIRSLVTLRCRTSWASVLLHPIGVSLVMAISVRSWWLSRSRGVEWKGRVYRPNI
jgi:chlorobactene glucosyltransferase